MAPNVGNVCIVMRTTGNSTLWERFKLGISQDQMYRPDDPIVTPLLQYITSLPIARVSEKDGGTQIKLTIEFVDGGKALFKPMRYPREQETLKNQFYFTDFERHNSEIASFHLDRLLGFRRAIPTVGRRVNITSELYNLSEGNFKKTFFTSPEGNHCFSGKCSYFCDTAHAICGNPDMVEGSLAVFLPTEEKAGRKKLIHPWRRSYSKRRQAQWENDDGYCMEVKERKLYKNGRRLLDLVDMAVFDFLIGNMDRHHYEIFMNFSNRSAPIHLDHGRGFGRAYHDEYSILAPLTQCCFIRHSTLSTLLKYHTDAEGLSYALRKSLLSDPLQPVLWEPHLAALDRRLAAVLAAVRSCLVSAEPEQVILQDYN